MIMTPAIELWTGELIEHGFVERPLDEQDGPVERKHGGRVHADFGGQFLKQRGRLR